MSVSLVKVPAGMRAVRDLSAELFRNDVTFLAWQGQSLVGMTWVEQPMPEPGDTVHGGTFGMNTCTDYAGGYGAPMADATHLQVPVTMWGDYVGDTVTRANCVALRDDYPETFVTVSYDYSSECLALALDQFIPEDLFDVIVGMANDYPLYGDEALSELEEQIYYEGWESYLRYDYTRLLGEFPVIGDNLQGWAEEMDSGELFILFRRAAEEFANAYPIYEDAVSVTFSHHDDAAIVAALTDLILTDMLASFVPVDDSADIDGI